MYGRVLSFQDLIIKKFGTKSAYVVDYYFYLIPFSLFYLLFVVFENFSYNQYKSIYPIMLKEVGLRVEQLVLYLLFLFGALSLPQFVMSYTLVYAVLLGLLIVYLYRQGDLVFSFSVSSVTRKLAKRMVTFNATLYLGAVISVVAANIDNFSISSRDGLKMGFVFEFATYVSTFILLPQRNVVAIAIPVLAANWKNRDMASIGNIYRRSSNTMLTYSVLLFGLIWLNVHNTFEILALNPIYYAGIPVIMYMGLKAVVEMSFEWPARSRARPITGAWNSIPPWPSAPSPFRSISGSISCSAYRVMPWLTWYPLSWVAWCVSGSFTTSSDYSPSRGERCISS